jgi:Protein kinase domain/GAF domain
VPFLLLLAAIKIVGALALWGAAQWREPVPYPHAFPPWFHLLFLAAFAGTGAALLWVARTDRRARAFGVVLVSFGTVFADPLLRHALLTAGGLEASIGRLLHATQVAAFTPAALWYFASVFPAKEPRRTGWFDPLILAKVSAGVGVAALLVNLADGIAGRPIAGPALDWLRAGNDGKLWTLLSVMDLPAFPYLVLKGRRAPPRERRHAFRFLAGLSVGMLPLVIDVLLTAVVPAYERATRAPARGRAVGMVVSAALLLVPPLTAYAVAEHLFDVRFMIRRVVQYALARYTVIAALSLPAVALALAIYQRRDERLGDVLTLRSPLLWLLLAALATVLWGRRMLLETIDRRFFREHYDARRILLTLASGSGHARNLPELATLVSAEVDRALHLQHVGLSIQDPEGAVLRDPQQHLPPLSTDSPLAALLAGSPAPLDVSLEPDSPSALSRLPSGDRQWLEDTHAQLLVPLRAPTGSLLGVMTLGRKRSELPFNPDDRQLLTAVAASVALVIDRRLLGGAGETVTEGTAADDQPAAQECIRCGRVHPRSAPQCRRCGGDLRDSLLPTHLAGKFAVDRRIGAGGMGVVYKGHDLTLDRVVALKTLPRLSAGEAVQLRREARAMASVEHPHLAHIYGAESWRGAPVLVLEHLPGGTLADRVASGPIPIAHVVTAGRAIAQALRHLHGLGMLHRDVKPSNIGYAAGDVPKLMDFGLAKLTAAQMVSPVMHDRLSDLSTQPALAPGPDAAMSTGRQFVGTTPYMSPEVLNGHRPTDASDLWSLSVSLYEALTRRHPFLREDLATTVTAITEGLTVDARTVRPDCPLELSVLLSSALSAKIEDRPKDIGAFLAALDGVPAS